MNIVQTSCRPRALSGLVGSAMLLLVAGCGSKDPTPLGSVYVKSGLITASLGGSVEVLAGEHDRIAGAKISIPAGALSRDTTITIAFDPASITTGGAEAIGPTVELGPDGTTFSTPAVVTLPYEGAPSRARLRVFVKDASGTTEIPAHLLTLDETTKTVRFQVTHFTEYQCGNGMEPPACDPASDCGPALGLPNWVCADGSLGGPTGNCVRDGNGACAWEVNWCPVACTPDDCGPAPAIGLMCPNGETAVTECTRHADGVCGWDIYCENTCDPTMGGFAPPPGDPSQPPPTCPGCTSDSDCPAGTLCEAMSGTCIPSQQTCGDVVCPEGELCCNPSCGICAPPGGACTQQECGTTCSSDPNGMTSCPPGTVCNPMTGSCDPDGSVCGNTVCGQGEYCCNPSCGVCAPFGAACTAEVCPSCGTDPTGMMTCAPDEVCGADGTCTPLCSAMDCGPAPGIANWTCEDGSVGGPTGRCIPMDPNTMPGGGSGNRPTMPPVCGWEINWCPRACEDFECGPQPGLPNYTCPDGMTVAGPTGRCLRSDDGTCGWEILSCPGN